MYTEQRAVTYSDIDSSLTASFASVMRYFQDAAISHSRSAGFPLKKLYGEGHAWILVSVNAEFYRYPEEGEIINVSTFTKGYDRVLGNRAFFITDSENKTIATASTVWVFTDTNTKHPCRVSDEIINAYKTEQHDCLPFLRRDNNVIKGEEKYSIIAAKRDTDTNKHVNNVRLAEFAADALPYGSKVKSAVIYYRSAVEIGDTAIAFVHRDKETYSVRLESPDERLLTAAIFNVEV